MGERAGGGERGGGGERAGKGSGRGGRRQGKRCEPSLCGLLILV